MKEKSIFRANERAKQLATILEDRNNDVYGWQVEGTESEGYLGMVVLNSNRITIEMDNLPKILKIECRNGKMILYV